MIPPASFFGLFMAAVLNLPEKPISHKLILMMIFLCIVVLEKIIDARSEDLQKAYPLFKAAICFICFVAVSIVYTTDMFEDPLRLCAIAVGGIVFGMAIYMPIRFQDGEKEKVQAENLNGSLPKNPNDGT